MAAHSILKNKTILIIGLIGIGVLAADAHEPGNDADIVRGFYESAGCIRTDQSPSQWCFEFETFLKSRAHATAAFVLGASFGFSFRSESIAEAAGAFEPELRHLAAYAAMSRLRYEEMKTSLNLTDEDVITVLGIRPAKFAAWKARAATADRDRSVTRAVLGIDL
jgi:hypothetical protein